MITRNDDETFGMRIELYYAREGRTLFDIGSVDIRTVMRVTDTRNKNEELLASLLSPTATAVAETRPTKTEGKSYLRHGEASATNIRRLRNNRYSADRNLFPLFHSCGQVAAVVALFVNEDEILFSFTLKWLNSFRNSLVLFLTTIASQVKLAVNVVY